MCFLTKPSAPERAHPKRRLLEPPANPVAGAVPTSLAVKGGPVSDDTVRKLMPESKVLRAGRPDIAPATIKPPPVAAQDLVSAGVKDEPVKLEAPAPTIPKVPPGGFYTPQPGDTIRVIGVALPLVAVRFVHTTGQVIRAAFPYKLAVAAAKLLRDTGHDVLGLDRADLLDLELLFRWEDKARNYPALNSSSIGIRDDLATQFYEIEQYHALTSRQAWATLRWAATLSRYCPGRYLPRLSE